MNNGTKLGLLGVILGLAAWIAPFEAIAPSPIMGLVNQPGPPAEGERATEVVATGTDGTVDTQYLKKGRYTYCHGVCDIPLRQGPSLESPVLQATVPWPRAHARSGHTYHALCQVEGGWVQDDRAVGSNVWHYIEVEDGYRGWISDTWFGFRGIVTACPGSVG